MTANNKCNILLGCKDKNAQSKQCRLTATAVQSINPTLNMLQTMN